MTSIPVHTQKQPAAFSLKSPADVILLLPRVALYAFNVLLIWQERSTQRHHLATLSERNLLDMGLTASDVQSEYAKPFWRA